MVERLLSFTMHLAEHAGWSRFQNDLASWNVGVAGVMHQSNRNTGPPSLSLEFITAQTK